MLNKECFSVTLSRNQKFIKYKISFMKQKYFVNPRINSFTGDMKNFDVSTKPVTVNENAKTRNFFVVKTFCQKVFVNQLPSKGRISF
jgi:hypothetical protein